MNDLSEILREVGEGVARAEEHVLVTFEALQEERGIEEAPFTVLAQETRKRGVPITNGDALLAAQALRRKRIFASRIPKRKENVPRQRVYRLRQPRGRR